MSADKETIRKYFAKLGLESEIADIYMALQTHGPQNMSQVSRNSGIERTRIYRLIDSLKKSSLVEVETHYKRTVFKAAPITNLQILLTQKEQELRDLQAELTQLHLSFTHTSLTSPVTHVQFYKGEEGIKQMCWNETRANSDNLSILYENMQGRVGSVFFDRWVRRCNERDIHFRGLISPHFMETQRKWYAKHRNERLKHWEQRGVADSVFPITYSTVTYDDVVGYYNWKDGEVFGIEVYNKEIALSQRRYFELLWQQASAVQDVDA